jgi:hypothetical protein
LFYVDFLEPREAEALYAKVVKIGELKRGAFSIAVSHPMSASRTFGKTNLLERRVKSAAFLRARPSIQRSYINHAQEEATGGAVAHGGRERQDIFADAKREG